jgi:hypothetical protein
MTSFDRRQITLGLASPWTGVAAWAFFPGEFWHEKSPSEWTEKDLQKLMTKSPWAKQVTASVDMSALAGRMGGGGMGGGRRGGGGMGGGGMRGGGGMGGAGAGGVGGGGMGGGGIEGGGGGMPDAGMGGGAMGGPGGGGASGPPEIRALVRWETAAPIREANKRHFSADSASHYLISVSGVPVMGGGMEGRPGQQQNPETTQDPAARQAAMEERRKAMVERLKTSAMLQRKGKDPIFPDRVEISVERRIFLFLFPHTSDPIQVADKDVTFLAKLGPIEIKTKFNLKQMTYKGALNL